MTRATAFFGISLSVVLTGGISNKAFAADPIMYELLDKEGLDDGPTPLFVDKQIYLLDAPKGVSAVSAWKLPGGKGENVKIVDIETGFDAEHEDHGDKFYLGNNPKVSDHGTAVMGILRGADNDFGVIGVAPKAAVGFHGFIEGELDEVTTKYINGINDAIRGAVSKMSAGDVLVIEQHMLGPDNKKYAPVEYWDEIFAELKKTTEKGIHCVAAAGNGDSDLDDPAYKKTFDLSYRDSGCILVGAAAIEDKNRMYFSNYGSRIDAFGFGENVTTTGYGQLFNGGKNRQYTHRFNGTSSATPIVAGAVALVSSIAKQQKKVVTPKEMRQALRVTGTHQGNASIKKAIGNLPDAKALVKKLGL